MMYSRYQGLVDWEVAAQNCQLWKQHFNTFLDFAADEHAAYVKCSACALKRLTVRRTGLID